MLRQMISKALVYIISRNTEQKIQRSLKLILYTQKKVQQRKLMHYILNKQ